MMKNQRFFLFLAGFMAFAPMASQAVEPMAPVRQQNFVCGLPHGGVTHIAATTVERCCSPNTHCVELLSGTVLGHENRANRT